MNSELLFCVDGFFGGGGVLGCIFFPISILSMACFLPYIVFEGKSAVLLSCSSLCNVFYFSDCF